MANSAQEVLAKMKALGIEVKPEQETEILKGGEADVVVDDDEAEVKADRDTRKTLSEVEETAASMGWKPEGEWEGPSEEWVDARTFLRNREYLTRIHNQNRKIKKLETVVDGMAKQHKNMFDAGYAKAKKELRAGLRDALRNEDDARAEAIEEELDNLEQKKQEIDQKARQEEQEQQKENINPVFVQWVERNDWFVKYPSMRSYAEEVGMEYARENQGLSNAEVYAYVEKEVKRKFPERFPKAQSRVRDEEEGMDDDFEPESSRPRQRIRRPVVESDTPARGGKKSSQRIELSAEEKDVARTLIKRGDYKNMAEYAADLVKYGVK